ncbi:MAG: helix-turn-helix domain-containing protein [Rhodobacteraceae bacterium]|nr:helix-turn-helix domain-containing protein [Paracoccaceae bacterium]
MPKSTRSPAELREMFGANLRLLAGQYRSVSELSRQLGINRTQFNRYLSGESFPRPDVLDRICNFFGVDARILLEPADSVSNQCSLLGDPFLADFVGARLNDIPESLFPAGFYQFSRRSFTNESNFVIGLIHVFRRSDTTFIRGYESRKSMQYQDLPSDPKTREYRGYLTRHEDGVVAIVSRLNAMTCSFNYLTQVASFENNHWVGYATRTVPESASDTRIVRLVYEHLGTGIPKALPVARNSGLISEDELKPFHRRLLKPDEPFR